MPHKNSFEPKDARVTNVYEDEDEDELDFLSLTSSSDVTPRPRRKKTGTQDLAEFLITTSPEEFQKNPPKRSSNPFFRRRNKSKASIVSRPPPSSSSSTPARSPNTVHRSNHIEIVPNETSSTSLARIASRTPSLASSRPSIVRRSVISNSEQPVLPSNRSSKQRESSLYSDSIRFSMSTRSHASNNNFASLRGNPLKRHDTDGTMGSRATTSLPQRMSQRTIGTADEDTEERSKKATEALVNQIQQHPHYDAVEKALLQRLERFQLAKMDKPSDAMTTQLAVEHIRALEASNQDRHPAFDNDDDCNVQSEAMTPSGNKPRKKIRHMQVQTMPMEDNKEEQQQQQQQKDPVTGLDKDHAQGNSDQAQLIEQLQQQLAEEQLQRKRLEATLSETRDHFETLSGLAYKKLRELWEDKMHWENACIDLREQLINGDRRDDMIPDFPDSIYEEE
ncbi:hypothetical protein LRAMOSA06512 [Lichtheimia ramosa]|uniref:Uncharacterized protein n=1 Tax=Lichtheimia ramosa TaxID=688394 RepID=A0A077X542_9FUNG|nr:hypothetical protein LRAMOSA06512 [Lichtheimia ramosa]